MARSWTATIEVVDHGVWNPDDPAACAALIAKINEARVSTDPRPIVRRRWWGEEDDKAPYLFATINDDAFSVDPGEHLVALIFPNGDVSWGGVADTELGRLRRPPADDSQFLVVSGR